MHAFAHTGLSQAFVTALEQKTQKNDEPQARVDTDRSIDVLHYDPHSMITNNQIKVKEYNHTVFEFAGGGVVWGLSPLSVSLTVCPLTS